MVVKSNKNQNRRSQKHELLVVVVLCAISLLVGQSYHPNTPNPPTDTESCIHIGDNTTLEVAGNGTWFSNVYSTDEADIVPPYTTIWETVFCQFTADYQNHYLFGGGGLLSIDDLQGLPDKFMINKPYPNPFNPSVTIEYALPQATTQVSIQIYDITGRLINKLVDGEKTAGWHSAVWHGNNAIGKQASSGLYLVRVIAGDGVKLTKVMLVR